MSDPRWWRVLRVVLLVLAILNHVWVSAVTGTINEDETYSMGEAINAVHGMGFTVPSIVSPDPGNVQYLHTVKFPAGLALAYAALLKLSMTPGMADFALDCLAGILFFVAWFFILETLRDRLSLQVRIFVWMFWLVFPAPLFAGQMTGHTTDILAVALFSGNLLFLLLGLKNPRRQLLYSGLGGMMAGLAALLKYVYWPLLAIGPLALAGLALLNWKEWRRLLWVAVVNTLVAAIFLAGQMVESQLATGHLNGYTLTLSNRLTTRMTPLDTPQWDRVLHATPTPAFSLGLSPVSFYTGRNLKSFPIRLAGDGYSWAYSGLVLLVFAAVSSRFIWKGRRDSAALPLAFVFVFGSVAILWAFAWQVWLSVAYETQGVSTLWIPLNDARYVSALFPFMLLGMAVAFFAPWELKNPWVKWLGIAGVMAILFYPAYISTASRWNILERQVSVGLHIRAEETYASRVRGLQKATAAGDRQDLPVVVFFREDEQDYADIRPIFLLAGVPGLILPDGTLRTSRPIRVVLIIRPENYRDYTDLIEQFDSSCLTQGDFTYCPFTLEPGQ